MLAAAHTGAASFTHRRCTILPISPSAPLGAPVPVPEPVPAPTPVLPAAPAKPSWLGSAWPHILTSVLTAVLVTGTLALTVYLNLPSPPAPEPVVPLPEPTPARPVVLPESVLSVPRKLNTITAKSMGPVTWVLPPNLAKALDLRANGNELWWTVADETPAKHYVGYLTVVESKATNVGWLEITVGKPPPEPDPVKPDPVKPDPPAPTDEFTKSLLVAWTAEPPDQRKYLPAIKNTFSAAAQVTVNDQNIKTYKQLNDVMFQVRVQATDNKVDVLNNIRGLIEEELTKVFSNSQTGIPIDAQLTDDNRKTIKTQFTRVVKALEALK